MEAMGLIAIIVNCYLIGQCGQLQRLFPWLSPEMTIISIVLLEVCMIQWRVSVFRGILHIVLLELTRGLVKQVLRFITLTSIHTKGHKATGLRR